MNSFTSAKNMFEQYTHATKQLAFEDWDTLPSDMKAAALFVRFFPQITLAWDKAKSFYGDDDEAVSTVCQYLIKNVSKIEAEPKKYSEAYIYRVAYNCLYCICHDRKIDKDRWELETSSTVIADDGSELSLFDTISANNHRDLVDDIVSNDIWDVINNSDPVTKKVVLHIVYGLPLTAYRGKNKQAYPELASIVIDEDCYEDVLADLRTKLAFAI